MSRSSSRVAAFFALALSSLALPSIIACGSKAEPPRHPVGDVRARLEAKLDLIELIVPDPTRAARLREIYVEAWQLGYDFDLARARSLQQAQDVAVERTSAEAQEQPLPEGALERMLVPDIELGRATFARYTALMLEARTLLSDDEFRKLEATR
jgi:hypothetical protein